MAMEGESEEYNTFNGSSFSKENIVHLLRCCYHDDQRVAPYKVGRMTKGEGVAQKLPCIPFFIPQLIIRSMESRQVKAIGTKTCS